MTASIYWTWSNMYFESKYVKSVSWILTFWCRKWAALFSSRLDRSANDVCYFRGAKFRARVRGGFSAKRTAAPTTPWSERTRSTSGTEESRAGCRDLCSFDFICNEDKKRSQIRARKPWLANSARSGKNRFSFFLSWRGWVAIRKRPRGKTVTYWASAIVWNFPQC